MKRLKARPMPPVPPTMATFSPLRSRLAASMRRHVKLLSRFIESESLSRPLPPTDVRRSNHQRTPQLHRSCPLSHWAAQTEYPAWVISGHFAMRQRYPLSPRKRTCAAQGMSTNSGGRRLIRSPNRRWSTERRGFQGLKPPWTTAHHGRRGRSKADLNVTPVTALALCPWSIDENAP